MRKGRRGGLWMNVGEIEVQDAPSLYLVMSTSQGIAHRGAARGHLGLSEPWRSSLAFSGKIEPAERQEFLKQFLELKESEQIYASWPGALKLTAAAGDPKAP